MLLEDETGNEKRAEFPADSEPTVNFMDCVSALVGVAWRSVDDVAAFLTGGRGLLGAHLAF